VSDKVRRILGTAVVLVAVLLGCKDERAKVDTATPLAGPGPGAEPFAPALARKLDEAIASRGKGYVARTRHLGATGAPKYVNRLLLEASPYLLQHAHNPVNWYPWGPEAFAAAKRLGRPILLSVGYSTCHWCHVMEEESFEDEEIAAYLNAKYIAIKVDRERRPDVDAIYMRAVQLLTGSGGWPMTVWLTPDGKPFFAATYVPPRRGVRGASVGLLEMLQRARQAYDEQPDAIAETAHRLVADIARMGTVEPRDDVPGASALDAAFTASKSRFDPAYGGLRSQRSKFPSSMPIRFLLRQHRRTGDAEALSMALSTLDHMAAGGIHDHVGGGFHRYSTDPQWLVPHFEKMLYDNAQLAVTYLEAFQASGDTRYAEVVRDILDYVARDLRADDGSFLSASDADSVGADGAVSEGAYFVWAKDELVAAVGKDAALAETYFAVTGAGNFEGRNVLSTPAPLSTVASALGMSADEAAAGVARVRRRLFEARSRRSPPARDDKRIAGWNGLMISAFARAARVLGEPEDLAIARGAADFVLERMLVDGRLRRSYALGRAELDAQLDDYAFVIAALLDLFEATSESRYLQAAMNLDRVLAAHYEDAAGGFFRTADDAEALLVRDKPIEDGALPSGNSVQALNLLRLYELRGDDGYRERADRALRACAAQLDEPAAAGTLLLALDFREAAPKEIVVVKVAGNDGGLGAVLARTFVPNHVHVAVDDGEAVRALSPSVPLVEGKVAIAGKPTAYVCQQRQCKLPTSDPAVFGKQLVDK